MIECPAARIVFCMAPSGHDANGCLPLYARLVWASKERNSGELLTLAVMGAEKVHPCTSVRLIIEQIQLVANTPILFFVVGLRKGLQNGGFLEERNAQDL